MKTIELAGTDVSHYRRLLLDYPEARINTEYGAKPLLLMKIRETTVVVTEITATSVTWPMRVYLYNPEINVGRGAMEATRILNNAGIIDVAPSMDKPSYVAAYRCKQPVEVMVKLAEWMCEVLKW